MRERIWPGLLQILVAIGSTIEGLRMGAKTTIARAVTFGEVVLASEVEWAKVGQVAMTIASA